MDVEFRVEGLGFRVKKELYEEVIIRIPKKGRLCRVQVKLYVRRLDLAKAKTICETILLDTPNATIAPRPSLVFRLSCRGAAPFFGAVFYTPRSPKNPKP